MVKTKYIFGKTEVFFDHNKFDNLMDELPNQNSVLKTKAVFRPTTACV